jgi:hypothetical protein
MRKNTRTIDLAKTAVDQSVDIRRRNVRNA